MEIPDEVLTAVEAVELSLVTLPGVNGIGVGMRESEGELFDELAIRILVDDLSDPPAGLPDQIAGVPVCLIERRYLPLGPPDLNCYPELRGGIHTIHPHHADHGTLGAIVQDDSAISSGRLLGLSCFHVVGDRESGPPVGVWQPTAPPFPSPTSPPGDRIGKVDRALFPDLDILGVKIGFVDAAVFDLTPAFEQNRTVSRAIMGEDSQHPTLADAITDTETAHLGMSVSKRGAMTRVTHGIVVSGRLITPWTVLGPDPRRFLVASVEITADRSKSTDGVFADVGDSGSVVMKSGHPTAVGLLWGGTDNKAWGAMTDIRIVERALEISMVWA